MSVRFGVHGEDWMLTDHTGPPGEVAVEARAPAQDAPPLLDPGAANATRDARRPPAALREHVARRWHSTLIQRVFAGCGIILTGVVLLIGITAWLGPALRPAEYGVLALLCLVQVVTIASLGGSTSPWVARALTLIACCTDCVLVASAAVIGGRSLTVVAFGAAFPMACAAVVPWRPGHQAVLAAVALLATVANSYFVSGPFDLADGGFAVLFIQPLVLAASVVVAYELERTRLAGGIQELERDRADGRLQELNANLERRVVGRTRELEERTQELERVVKELQSISYTISHDLRQPLRGINGFSAALREEYAEALGTRGCLYLDRVCMATERMGEMIDSMLRLGRVTRGDLVREPVNLSAIVRSMSADLQAISPDREVRWIIQDNVWADGDPGLMRVVIENLIDNALKFSRDRQPAYIEFGMYDAGGEIIYYVRDNGVGFDMRYYEKLFGLFTRLHGREEFEGTGIGLATVQRAVDRHGGRTWAQASVSAGATFFFTLGRSGAQKV